MRCGFCRTSTLQIFDNAQGSRICYKCATAFKALMETTRFKVIEVNNGGHSGVVNRNSKLRSLISRMDKRTTKE